MQDTWVQSWGQNDLLEKEMETHSNILTWRIPWTEEPGKLQSMGSQRVWQDWVTNTSTSWIVMLISDSNSIKDISEMCETFHLCALQILSAPCLSQVTSAMTRPVRALRSSGRGAVWVCVVSLWFPPPEPLSFYVTNSIRTSSAVMLVQTRSLGATLVHVGVGGRECFPQKEHHKMLFIRCKS